MLYYFLYPLREQVGAFRVFNYISFRAAGAAVTALLVAFIVGPMIIRRLSAMRYHQVVREGTPDSHKAKATTPTMGGIIILAAVIVPTLLWARFDRSSWRYVALALLVMAWMGVIGFWDDYLKLKQKAEGKPNRGLIERHKLMGQVAIGLFLGWCLWQFPITPNLPGASTTLPFFKYVLVVPATAALAWLYVLFVTFVLTAMSNAVNLTDGLDGLAAGLSATAATTLAIFAYAIGRIDFSSYLQIYYMRGAGELTVFCTAIFGATIGFLWYNAHPAQVFMGDTGSLALGGALGAVAILLKSEFILVFVGAVFIAETVSVLLQRYVYKFHRIRRGEDYAKAHKVFLKAPLHHHFEMKGWKETQVVVRFWIIGILAALLAISTLKLR